MALTNKKLAIITSVSIALSAFVIVLFFLINLSPASTAATAENQLAGDQPVICNFADLVGQSVEVAEERLAQENRQARIVAEGSPVTMDYRPDRVTVQHDENQIVTQVTCG